MTTLLIDLERRLGERFTNLWRRCVASEGTRDPGPVWESLRRRYSESDRHYHDLSHLAQCFDELDAVRDDLERVDQVEMAVWFHDIVNEHGRPDNEAQSAELFAAKAQGAIEPTFVAATEALIMATTHRDEPESSDMRYVCDIDMSSLGKEWDQFFQDSVNLRREYEGPDEDYFPGKRRFLEALLARPRIYYTDSFFDRYEQQARANIRRFLDLIGKGRAQL